MLLNLYNLLQIIRVLNFRFVIYFKEKKVCVGHIHDKIDQLYMLC